jgi:hypothetical protein
MRLGRCNDIEERKRCISNLLAGNSERHPSDDAFLRDDGLKYVFIGGFLIHMNMAYKNRSGFF